MISQQLLERIRAANYVTRQLKTKLINIGDHGRSLSTAVQIKSNENERPKRTALYDLHRKFGGKMVNFAGYYLPIQYDDVSINASHLHTRTACSIFDVSHMLQTRIYGKHAVEFLESLCVTDIVGMKKNQSALSLFIIDDTGGIIDDLIITKISQDVLYVVSNASREQADKELLTDRLAVFLARGKDVRIDFLDSEEQSLIAVQGPKTALVLQPFVDVDLRKLYFMNSTLATICGVKNCRISRCGYTGEDGVEISVPSRNTTELVESCLNNEVVQLAGLGARDTLRLESGMCLYGNDIDETTTPVEAGLTWTVGKRRKNEKCFPGSSVILNQLKDGVNRKRVGVIKYGGPAARAGTKILDLNDEHVGYITSGCPSPSLGLNIAMGYVETSYSDFGTDVQLEIRRKLHKAYISKMPFGTLKYYTKAKNK